MNLRMLGAIILLAILWYARPAPAGAFPPDLPSAGGEAGPPAQLGP